MILAGVCTRSPEHVLSVRIDSVQQQREISPLASGSTTGNYERIGPRHLRDQWNRRPPGETELTLLSREWAINTQSMAAAYGTSGVMRQRWKRKLLQPSGQRADRRARINGLHLRLYSMFQPYLVLSWIRTENRQLGFKSPMDLLVAGQLHKVEAALDYLER